MSRCLYEASHNRPDPNATALRRLGHFSSITLLIFLTGCASTGTQGQIFDYASVAAVEPASTPAKVSGGSEALKARQTSTLLGAYQTGNGFAAQPEVLSNGRYNIYVFETEYGTYPVIGDALARRHIQELIALDALKKSSPAEEFVGGVGNAVASPIKGVVATVSNPIGAAKGTYTNVERKVKSAQRVASQAGEFVTTFGKVEKKRPAREDESLVEKIVARPKAKRRLATTLGVDPYTHFVPLSNELDKVASYSAAGAFGITRAVSFVPGVAGTIISAIGTLDSLTEQTLDMGPDEMAAVNRERLEKLNVSNDVIKPLLLSDKLTPTEKTQAVGYLSSLSGTPGLDALAAYVASTDTRYDAFAALQALGYLSTQPFGDSRPTHVEIIDRVPVLTIDGSRRIALFTSDDLFWTTSNATQLASLGTALRGTGRSAPKPEIWISGNTSAMAKRELQHQGWIVKADIFGSSL